MKPTRSWPRSIEDVDRQAVASCSGSDRAGRGGRCRARRSRRTRARARRAGLRRSCVRGRRAVLRCRTRPADRRLAHAARAAHRAGDVQTAARHATAARELASDPIALADLVLVESDLRMREGDLEGAHRALTGSRGAPGRHRPPTRGDDAAPGVEAPHLPSRSAERPPTRSKRVLALLPDGEHELVHLVALSMSRTVAGRDGARDSALAAAAAAANAPHGHAHTLGIAWPLDLARGIRRGARGDGPRDGDPARGRLHRSTYRSRSCRGRSWTSARVRWEPAMAAAHEALGAVRGDAAGERGRVGRSRAGPDGGCAWQRRRHAERMHSAPWRATSSSVFAAPRA